MLTFGVMELLGLKKRPLRSSQTINPAPPHSALNQLPMCHIQMYFEHSHRWWFHHFPGQSLPTLNNFFCEKKKILISNLDLLSTT